MYFKAHKQRVQELDVEGMLLERRMEDLNKDLATVQHAYAENRRERAARTPLHALPDDVLKLILEAAYEHRLYEDCPKAHVLAVSHVSRHLRRLALSLPRLWRCIHTGPAPMPFLELVLSRTGNLPVFVVSSSEDRGQHSDTDLPMDTDVVEVNRALRHVDQLNHLLQVYTRRIAYLSIAAQNVRILRLTLPSLCRKPFPLIEYIDLEAAPDALHASRNYSLAQSPNLRTLWLAAIPFSFSNVIYENLTSLTIGEITIVPGDLRDAAKACPNLTVLHLDAVGIKLDGGEFIRFPRLESLRLANIAGPDGYLDWLDAPALSLIAISFCTLASHGVSTFDPSILRPFPTVRLLRCESLDAIPAPPFDGNVFQYVPGATTLALRDCCMGEGSLAAHLAAAVPAPLPALQTLVVGELESGGLEAVLRIVRHRIQHEVPLKEVQLGKDIREAMDAELLRTLEELVMVTTAPDVDDLDDS